MGYTIAVAGKGGTGKTTISALLVRLLKEKKMGSILAVDADPNSNLGEALGVQINETVGGILDKIAVNPESVPPGMTKDRFIEYQVQSAVYEGQGFDLLSMGRPEGAGCYCYVNNVLRSVMGKLVKDYDYIVIDNEAGLEHLSRRTTRSADVLLAISDATVVGLKAAGRLSEIVKELNIKMKRSLLLINRLEYDIEGEKLKKLIFEYIGNIPVDEEISVMSLNGGSVWDLTAKTAGMEALRKIGEKIWQTN